MSEALRATYIRALRDYLAVRQRLQFVEAEYTVHEPATRPKLAYAEGDLGDRSFVFRGPHGGFHLRARNLRQFIELATGIDDGTWLFHLQRQDYSQWFRETITDEDLAREVARIERRQPLNAATSRKQVRELITGRYFSLRGGAAESVCHTGGRR